MLALGVLASSSAMAQNAPGVECTKDIECNDGNIHTMNWCVGFVCNSMDRSGNECTESEWSWCFWDNQCDDGNATTEDWCDFGTCRNHPKSSLPGNCDATTRCMTSADCDDGNPATVNWCHEQTCEGVQRDDDTCQESALSCNTDQDCLDASKEYESILVTWCQDNTCHVTLKRAESECVAVNTLPDY